MQKFDVQLTVEGQVYRAECSVEGKMLTVTSVDGLGRKAASTSASNEVLAKMMLRELINESKRHGWKK